METPKEAGGLLQRRTQATLSLCDKKNKQHCLHNVPGIVHSFSSLLTHCCEWIESPHAFHGASQITFFLPFPKFGNYMYVVTKFWEGGYLGVPDI